MVAEHGAGVDVRVVDTAFDVGDELLGHLDDEPYRVVRSAVVSDERKLPDLNAHDVEQAAKIIEGTARSMGVEVG